MSHPARGSSYRVAPFDSRYDLGSFDCGQPTYNAWLARHAATSVRAGVCAVYLLLESGGPTERTAERVVGYYAINPTQVVREDVPMAMGRGWPQTVPGWKLGKLAVHRELRADRDAYWGRQLLRNALETIVNVAAAGGGKVIVVDADHPRLVGFYVRNGFKSTGLPGSLTLYLKISTARATLEH